MSICTKIKKIAVCAVIATALAPSSAFACKPWNPICIFQLILKATPGLPVLDIVSLPALIPHIPSAIQKEGQVMLKEELDKQLELLRSGKLPNLSKLTKLKDMSNILNGAGKGGSQEAASVMESFPQLTDSTDPVEIARVIEKLYMVPGCDENGKCDAKCPGLSAYDREVMEYRRNQFLLNNMIDAMAVYTQLDATVEKLQSNAEEIQNQLSSSTDLNQATRVNYDAQVLEYQLMILQNQLNAIGLQIESMYQLTNKKPQLTRSILKDL